MKSLQKNLKNLRDILKAVSVPDKVFHYARPKDTKAPWIVWQEDSETSSFGGDDHKAEQQVHGTIDCYTQTEYDPLLDEVQNALNAAEVGWNLLSVQYEDETKLIHYEWEFFIA